MGSLHHSGGPLVSVVTPFFNTAEFLGECIESVLRQSHGNWEYILVDNRSDDGSTELAERFARRDSRLRLVRNDRFLSQVDNYNHALRQISPDSVFCKVVQADDWIFPRCLEEMVAVARVSDSIAVVGAYGLFGHSVYMSGLPYESAVLSGRDVCRRFFLDDLYLFGTPTSLLIRSDLVRAREPFYDSRSPLEDGEVCFELLHERDFGFVHQVLTFTRRSNDSLMTGIRNYEPLLLLKLMCLARFGDRYLDHHELAALRAKTERRYRRLLGDAMLRGREEGFWAFHRKGMESIGYTPTRVGQLVGLSDALLGYLANPGATLGSAWRRLRGTAGHAKAKRSGR